MTFINLKIAQCTAQTSDLSFVPALLRRRLSANIKASLTAAHLLCPDAQDIATVYASRFGEWRTTTAQLELEYAENRVSAASFGLSVHNAGIGLWHLISQNHRPYTSIAAGLHSFDLGLLEALSILTKNQGRVLYIYSDESRPELYAQIFPDFAPLTIGALIEPGADFAVELGNFSAAPAAPLALVELAASKQPELTAPFYRIVRAGC
ncbi:MAG: beta-ketoacyl synthase chain length factor [Candidatus Margulisbacteria bacterium]|jgi:hypothetical protein|nr:beta-ketoacyl synthase chain length factor [Candidatus Margulisiibacteriota bacterium]